MKRIKYLAVLLLTVGVLGLTGCGSSSADVGVQEPTEIADESQVEAGILSNAGRLLFSPEIRKGVLTDGKRQHI